MVKVDFPTLYRLQDKVLSIVFGIKTGFYLTGGTCLHRFYQEQRYSDDLDLFSNDNQLFRDDVRSVRRSLDDAAISLDVVVDSHDFVRFIVADLLKVDLVNDRVYRIGSSVRTGRKCTFDMEELRFRLESFPLSLIEMLQVTDSSFVSELQRDYRLLLDCILSINLHNLGTQY